MKDISISALIKELQDLQDLGADTIQLEGTLMCAADGNKIIASTIPQV